MQDGGQLADVLHRQVGAHPPREDQLLERELVGEPLHLVASGRRLG